MVLAVYSLQGGGDFMKIRRIMLIQVLIAFGVYGIEAAESRPKKIANHDEVNKLAKVLEEVAFKALPCGIGSGGGGGGKGRRLKSIVDEPSPFGIGTGGGGGGIGIKNVVKEPSQCGIGTGGGTGGIGIKIVIDEPSPCGIGTGGGGGRGGGN